MTYLYLNHYKGFVNQIFPILPVNFLVGDNSSGKTSVLTLISVLQDDNFWAKSSFEILDKYKRKISLGSFEEIKNQSTQADFFEIGILFDTYLQQNSISALKITFSQENNIPIVSEIKWELNDKTISAKIGSKRMLISVKAAEIRAKEAFKNWCQSSETSQDYTNSIEILDAKNIKKSISAVNRTVFSDYVTNIPDIFPKFISEPPIRTEPKERYQLSEDVDYSYLAEILMETDKRNTLYDFGKKSALFDNISLAEMPDKKTYNIVIYFQNIALSIKNVGYGVSQILPILTDLFQYKNTYFSLQQPEIHLHPKAQAEFGELIFKIADKQKNKFLIETHSDYLIDRFRACLHVQQNIDIAAQVVFFHKVAENIEIHTVQIEKSGEYEECEALLLYREFFINETSKIWDI